MPEVLGQQRRDDDRPETAYERSKEAGVQPVPMVERMAYTLRAWEESHAGWAQPMINGSIRPPATKEDPEPEPYAPVKTECQCQFCKDARMILADYDKQGGDERAEKIRY